MLARFTAARRSPFDLEALLHYCSHVHPKHFVVEKSNTWGVMLEKNYRCCCIAG
jgi:hypothetical protein